jgi:hypothetical protein
VHARIAMLAAVGWVVQERWHPLFGDIEGKPADDGPAGVRLARS